MINYDIFISFLERYKAQEFRDIHPNDPHVVEIEKTLSRTGQYFHVADLINLKVLYASSNAETMFGVDRAKIDPSAYINALHPHEIKRFGIARSKLFKMSTDMMHNPSNCDFISSNFKSRTALGEYIDLLYQLRNCYTEVPYKTVLSIQVNTDITGMLAHHKGYHFYLGTDKSYFRYPDKKLLMTGNVFTEREFDILKAIARGMDSHEIAEALFLSVHTVNTHRRNILIKSGKRNTHELVHDLQEKGVI